MGLTAKEHAEITIKLLEERKRLRQIGRQQAEYLKFEKSINASNRKHYKRCYGKNVKGYQR